MRKALSVSQVNEYIRASLKHDPIFINLRVVGQVDNLRSSYDHLYFSLKEGSDLIDCVIYYYEDLDISIKEGEKVLVTGNLSYFSYSSRLVISVRETEKYGESEEYLEFLKLRAELEKDGFFDQVHKLKIPEFPKKIGLITSKEGAAIGDFLNILKISLSPVEVFLYPVKVQGRDALNEIIAGLTRLEDASCDVIVLTRGGGSESDLETFNDEDLVKKIYSMKTPLISAIGHTRDLTLCDLAADLSLQTPTQAGNYLSSGFLEKRRDMKSILEQMADILRSTIDEKDLALAYSKKYLEALSPVSFINRRQEDLSNLMEIIGEKAWQTFNKYDGALLFYKSRLEFEEKFLDLKKRQIFIKKNGKEVFSKYSLKTGDRIQISFADGSLGAEIKND